MAKIFLFSIHDYACSGIRSLGAYLKELGHEISLFFLGSNNGLCVQNYLSSGSIPNIVPQDLTFIVHSIGEINLLPPNLDFDIPKVFLRFIQVNKPDIIGYSGRSILDPYFTDWFIKIKSVAPQALLVAGGFGPSLNPGLYLERGVDCVVRGEGEEALAELTQCIAEKKPWKNVRNIVYLDKKILINNKFRPVIKDLDSLPPQMRNERAIYTVMSDNILEMDPLPRGAENRCFLSRGCVGTCSYCSAGHWIDQYKNDGITIPKYRYPSNDKCIKILKTMKLSGAKAIGMEDDYFIRPYKIMKDFLFRYKNEINLPLYAYLHPIFIKNHPDIIQEAVNSGLAYINLPIQSADEKVNRDLFQRKTDLDIVLKYAKYANELYIPFVTHFIDGFISNSFNMEEYLLKNIDFIKKLPKFNPGFPNLISYTISYLRLYSNSPLLKQNTVIKMPPKVFFHRAMMMLFRYILDDVEFDTLYNKNNYIDDPEQLLTLYTKLRHSKIDAYMVTKSQELAGKHVFIFGCGEIYNTRKHLLATMKAEAIITNVPVKERIVDNLPVLDANKAITDTGSFLPIIICVKNAQACAKKIKKDFPDYPNENIIGFGG